jgi:DnaD/phage-associated family protein
MEFMIKLRRVVIMTGWIKLWRNLLHNGHLSMPAAALKIWLFCLLTAAPYPDQAKDLAVGELWLSYRSLQEQLRNGKTRIGLSTISAAFKYLEQNGYLTLQPHSFKGTKVRIVNWAQYQSSAFAPPPGAAFSSPSNSSVPPGGARNSPGTLSAGAPCSSPGSGSAPPGGTAEPEKPYGDVACGSPKNNIKNLKEYSENRVKNYKNYDTEISDVLVDVTGAFETEFGRKLSPLEINQLALWQKNFSAALLGEALTRASLHDKRTFAYIGGILKNWQQAGISTAEEARRRQSRPERAGVQGGMRYACNKPGYHPEEVDWDNEPDTL